MGETIDTGEMDVSALTAKFAETLVCHGCGRTLYPYIDMVMNREGGREGGRYGQRDRLLADHSCFFVLADAGKCIQDCCWWHMFGHRCIGRNATRAPCTWANLASRTISQECQSQFLALVSSLLFLRLCYQSYFEAAAILVVVWNASTPLTQHFMALLHN